MTLFLMILIAVSAAAFVYWRTINRLLPMETRVDEIHPVTTDDGWTITLLRYRPEDGKVGEPVFICHGFSVNHWNFALPAGRSLVDTLVAKGYDCWLIDLRGNRSSVPPAGEHRNTGTFDGYVLSDIPAALARIREKTGYDQVHWVGHSMGGLLLYAYEVVHGADALASGTTLGAPPGFNGLNVSHHKRILSAIRKYPWLAETVLRALAPIVPVLKPRTSLLPVNWNNLHADMGPKAWFNLAELACPSVAETLIDTATFGYLGVRDNTVDILAGFKTLRTPLLVIHGVLDPLATVGNVRAFFERLPSDDKRILELSKANGHRADYDHIDLAFGLNGPEEVHAPILEWISAHSIESSAEAEATTEKVRAAVSEMPEAASPAPAKAAASAVELQPRVATVAQPGGLWGGVLEDAAKVLSDLDDDLPAEEPSKSKPRVSKRKRVVKRAAAKKASAGKPRGKKAGQKRKSVTKAKKKLVKKKPVKKKPAKKKPVKKKLVKKKPATKKAAKKRKPIKKTARKKPAKKKKLAKKKTVAQKTPRKKVVKKKAPVKRASKKKTVKKKKAARSKAKK